MTTTLDQPAGKAVEAMPDDVIAALDRLAKRSGDQCPLIVYRAQYFPGDAKQAGWTATANLGKQCFAGEQQPTPDEAVNAWLKEANERRSRMLEDMATLDRFAREPYDARSPNAEERERAEFDENNVGELHDGGPM